MPVYQQQGRLALIALIIVAILSATGVGNANEPPVPPPQLSSNCVADLEVAVNSSPLPDVSVRIGTAAGELFSYSKGSAAPASSDTFRVASASKWVSGTMFALLVQNGTMSLEDRPSDYLQYWKPEGRKGNVTLLHLITFTSGMQGGSNASRCMLLTHINVTHQECAEQLYRAYPDLPYEPGTSFAYSNEGLQVAVAMAEKASGQGWEELYSELIKAPLNISSESNFRNRGSAGGGLSISLDDFTTFLTHMMLLPPRDDDPLPPIDLSTASLLTRSSRDIMNTDHTALPEVVVNEDKIFSAYFWPGFPMWHYGVGHWVECPAGSPAWIPSCTEDAQRGVHSSMGGLGFYPLVDYRPRQGMEESSGLYLIVSPSPAYYLTYSGQSEAHPMVLSWKLTGDIMSVLNESFPVSSARGMDGPGDQPPGSLSSDPSSAAALFGHSGLGMWAFTGALALLMAAALLPG